MESVQPKGQPQTLPTKGRAVTRGWHRHARVPSNTLKRTAASFNEIMSFGRPPSVNIGFQVSPPDRGSFPLDHFGECKEAMKRYMECLKQNSSTSSPCRALSKDYLNCRMQKGLMERDEWKNLGMADVADDTNDAPNKTEPPEKSQKT